MQQQIVIAIFAIAYEISIPHAAQGMQSMCRRCATGVVSRDRRLTSLQA
jgi:hypothetical protein